MKTYLDLLPIEQAGSFTIGGQGWGRHTMLESPQVEPMQAIEAKWGAGMVAGLEPSRRILLVDDEEDLRRLYSDVLTGCGYQVDTASDGDAGWKAIHTESYTADSYDLLVTDNTMPKLSGIGLIKKVRSAGLNLPVILASGNVPDDTESLRLAAIIHKPFGADELVETVKRALRAGTPVRESWSDRSHR